MGDSYNLVVIESESEYRFLVEKLKYHDNGYTIKGRNYQSYQYWIGLMETEERNKFEWVDGSSLTYGAKFFEDPWEVYNEFDKEPNKVSVTYKNIITVIKNKSLKIIKLKN